MQFSAKSFALDSIFSFPIVVFRCDRTDASRFFRTRRSIARVNNAVIKKVSLSLQRLAFCRSTRYNNVETEMKRA